MTFYPLSHHRRSIRLKGYDYSQPGAYFVTLVTQRRVNWFGKIEEGVIDSSQFGDIVYRAWMDLPRHYPNITLDWFVLMPNHLHAILFLNDDAGRGGSFMDSIVSKVTVMQSTSDLLLEAETRPYSNSRRHGLPEIVRALKSFSARRINNLRGTTGQAVWQRNYFEHIIRNKRELNSIRTYIADNPPPMDRR